MFADVIFSRDGDLETLTADDHEFFWRESVHIPIQIKKWEDNALALARWALKNELSLVQVFLCIKSFEPEALINHQFLPELVRTAREHCWGASIYVVIDPKWEAELLGSRLHEYLDSLNFWFEKLREAGATDVIQANLTPAKCIDPEEVVEHVWTEPTALRSLRFSTDNSLRRQKVLSQSGRWAGLRRKEDQVLKQLLQPFSIYHASNQLPSVIVENLVTIIETHLPKPQRKLIEQATKIIDPQSNHLVALPYHLQEPEGFGYPPKFRVIKYRSPFELRYFFHLLQTEERALPEALTNLAHPASVSAPSPFALMSGSNSPVLLATNALPPNDPRCLDAAREVGRVTRNKSAHARHFVHPGAGSHNLAEILERLHDKQLLHLTAWLHIAHGEKGKGMLEAASGALLSPQEWLKCFQKHRALGGSLALAIFSACDTKDMALGFAEAGVGVTIGFDGEVDGRYAHLLTAEVIGAALRANGNSEAILQAFAVGRAALLGKYHCHPVMYRSERGKPICI